MKNPSSQNTPVSPSSGNRLPFTNWSLRTKLVSAFLIVTLVPVAIISYLNYRSTTQALVQAANVKIAGAAQVTADQVDTFLHGDQPETAAVVSHGGHVEALAVVHHRKVEFPALAAQRHDHLLRAAVEDAVTQ